MAIKIVVDSACDCDQAIVKKLNMVVAPLSVTLDDTVYVDDASLDFEAYSAHMKSCKSFKTACPSPQQYMDVFTGDDDILVVPISEPLSGSYQSAMVARAMVLEQHPEKCIHVFSSCTAVTGQLVLAIKIHELSQQGKSTQEIIEEIEKAKKHITLYFMLESLDYLAKGGRVSPFVAKAASMLHVRCIMLANDMGKIEMAEKMIGEKKALKRIAAILAQKGEQLAEKTLCISHCQALDKVQAVLAELKTMCSFKEILVFETGGLSSIYANVGGIIIAY
ncbi:MAG: DegV family protein [Hyphomonadaceae bacterium]|nr:DegV family protein [Clostridia bacterium]